MFNLALFKWLWLNRLPSLFTVIGFSQYPANNKTADNKGALCKHFHALLILFSNEYQVIKIKALVTKRHPRMVKTSNRKPADNVKAAFISYYQNELKIIKQIKWSKKSSLLIQHFGRSQTWKGHIKRDMLAEERQLCGVKVHQRSQEASNVIDPVKVEVIFKITYPIESWNFQILSFTLSTRLFTKSLSFLESQNHQLKQTCNVFKLQVYLVIWGFVIRNSKKKLKDLYCIAVFLLSVDRYRRGPYYKGTFYLRFCVHAIEIMAFQRNVSSNLPILLVPLHTNSLYTNFPRGDNFCNLMCEHLSAN